MKRHEPASLWIVADADFPEGRGGTPRIRNLAIGFLKQGWDVEVLIPHAAGYVMQGQNTDTKGVYQGVRFEFLNGSTARPASEGKIVLSKLWGNIKLSFRYIFSRKPDTLILYSYSLFDTGILLFIAKIWKTKVVLDVCDERFDLYASGWEKSWVRSINAVQHRISDWIFFHLADGFFVVSAYLTEKIKRLSKEQPILSLPLVVMVQKSVRDFREPENPRCAYVGSLIEDEGIEMMIDCVAALREDYPNLTVDVYGGFNGSTFEKTIREMIRTLRVGRQFVFCGNVASYKLVDLLSTYTALLLPRPDTIISRAGFPGKLGEYLCSTRPVIATNFGDMKRYFTDGTTAFISEEPTAASYLDTLRRAFRDAHVRNAVGMAGYKLAVDLFDAERVAKSAASFLFSLH